jgi:hypothetical protein
MGRSGREREPGVVAVPEVFGMTLRLSPDWITG